MATTFTATATVLIAAGASRVWEALTRPEQIKKYLFGTEVVTDWKVGSPITYNGVWQGKAYEDKGRILKVESNRLFESTYWSGFSGLPDVPENYQTVRYELSPAKAGTRLTVTQTNVSSAESRDHSQKNWEIVLEAMRKMIEEGGTSGV